MCVALYISRRWQTWWCGSLYNEQTSGNWRQPIRNLIISRRNAIGNGRRLCRIAKRSQQITTIPFQLNCDWGERNGAHFWFSHTARSVQCPESKMRNPSRMATSNASRNYRKSICLIACLFITSACSIWQENVRPKLYVELGKLKHARN